MNTNRYRDAGVLLILVCQPAIAGIATFTPIGPVVVDRGTDVVFEITISVETLASFDAADIVIGSNTATDILFDYSVNWTSAFSNTTTPSSDAGFYNQDIFVGGNNPSAVGTTVVLGRVTIDTSNTISGNHVVAIDNSFDGISRLALGGNTEALNGSAVFAVLVPVPAVSSWGLFALVLMMLAAGTIFVRRNTCFLQRPHGRR